MRQTEMFSEEPQTRRYSLLELLSCAEREVKMRQQVYPNRVQTGRMSRAMADRETAMMAQIAAELRELAHAKGWGV